MHRKFRETEGLPEIKKRVSKRRLLKLHKRKLYAQEAVEIGATPRRCRGDIETGKLPSGRPKRLVPKAKRPKYIPRNTGAKLGRPRKRCLDDEDGDQLNEKGIDAKSEVESTVGIEVGIETEISSSLSGVPEMRDHENGFEIGQKVVGLRGSNITDLGVVEQVENEYVYVLFKDKFVKKKLCKVHCKTIKKV